MTARAPSSSGVSEWEPGTGPSPSVRDRALVVLVLAVAPLALAFVALLASVAVLWAAAAVVTIAVLAWAVSQGRLLRGAAVPASEPGDARVVNIVRGLAGDLSMPAPRVFVSPGVEVNAAVLPGSGGGVIVVTRAGFETLTLTELEAVVAHCLVRLRDGGLRWALASAAAGGIGPRAAPFVGELSDARAASVTRYPPALASAITKASPARGRGAALWFHADGRSHLPADQRAAALLDL